MTIAKVSEDTLKIQSYLENQSPGTFIDYLEIERGSGVRMDEQGKTRLRSAAKRAKIEYSASRGKGIQLASPENGVSMVLGKFVRVDNAVKRAEKTHRNIIYNFSDEMEERDRQTISQMGLLFGAVRAAAEQFRIFSGGRSKTKDVSKVDKIGFKPVKF